MYASDVHKRWPNGIFVPGANPGFHEGVADILSLAVGTAEYFQVICVLLTSYAIIFNSSKNKDGFCCFPRCSRCFYIPVLVS